MLTAAGRRASSSEKGRRRGRWQLDRSSGCLLGSRCTDRAAVHHRLLMLADLAGDHPRLRCISNHRAAFAHAAICGAARDLHEPDSAHAVPLLVPTSPPEISLGTLGAKLCRCYVHDVHHGAAHLPRPARRQQGAELLNWTWTWPHAGPLAWSKAMLYNCRLRPSLRWHALGHEPLDQTPQLLRRFTHRQRCRCLEAPPLTSPRPQVAVILPQSP